MPNAVAKRPQYNEIEIEQGLRAVAAMSGNTARAEELLRTSGMKVVPASTLRNWRRDKPEQYRRVQEEIRPELNARMSDINDDLANAYMDAEYATLEAYAPKIKEMDGQQLATAASKFAIASGIKQDKARLYRGEPSTITRTENLGDLVKGMRARFGSVVSVEAEDVTAVLSAHNGDARGLPNARD